MNTPARRYWFPAKRYGWGWGLPCRWQGWMVMALYVALLAAGGFVLRPAQQAPAFGAYTAFVTLLLVGVCWLTGEPPRWRWGDDGGR